MLCLSHQQQCPKHNQAHKLYLPYSQDFNSFTGGSDVVYPAGFQGWLVAAAAPSSGARTGAPSSDKTLTTSGSAANGSTGVYDFSGKIGIFDNSGNDIAIALALNTTSIMSPNKVKVNFDAMVIRNLYEGGANNIINGLVLQCRIGTTGEFTNLGNCVQNGVNTQIAGNDVLDIKSLSFTLPQECSNQPVLQLRWIFRTVPDPQEAGQV